MAATMSTKAALKEHPGHADQKVHGKRYGLGKAASGSFVSGLIQDVKANGGATVDVRKGSKAVTSGWMVAQKGKSLIISEADFNDPAKASKAIGSFLKERRELLRNEKGVEGARRRSVLGAWHDTAHGEVVLDVVDSVRSRKDAARLGARRNQQSVFNLGTFEEVGTGGTGDRDTARRYGEALGATEAARRNDGRGDRRLRGGGGSGRPRGHPPPRKLIPSPAKVETPSRPRPRGLGGFVVSEGLRATIKRWVERR